MHGSPRRAVGRFRTSTTHVFSAAFDQLIVTSGIPVERICKLFNRDIRTVQDWRTGKRPCPKPFFELLRLVIDDRDRTWSQGKYRKCLRVTRGRLIPDCRAYWGLCANDEFLPLEYPPATFE
jgi:hypothetical protein